MEDILIRGLKELGIDDGNKKLLPLLLLYIKEIKIFNAVFNLVKVKDDAELAVSHILDSLAAYRFFNEEIKARFQKSAHTVCIADAGSGAGFPGIPLSCFFFTQADLLQNEKAPLIPNIKFTLIERMKKRCGFLHNVKAVLNLSDMEILESEVENVPQYTFDIVTCRAFRPLDKHILYTLLHCTKPDGKLFLYKATEEKIYEETELLKKENLKFKIEKLYVPFLNKERNLLIVG